MVSSVFQFIGIAITPARIIRYRHLFAITEFEMPYDSFLFRLFHSHHLLPRQAIALAKRARQWGLSARSLPAPGSFYPRASWQKNYCSFCSISESSCCPFGLSKETNSISVVGRLNASLYPSFTRRNSLSRLSTVYPLNVGNLLGSFM